MILLLSFLFFDRLLHGGFLHCLVFVLIVLDETAMIHVYQYFHIILHVAYITHYLIWVAVVIFYLGVLIFNLPNHLVCSSPTLFNASIDYIIEPSYIFLDVLEGVLNIFQCNTFVCHFVLESSEF